MSETPKVNEPLPLHPGARTCIQSGYCCRQAPCPFGEWDPARHQCKHLTDENKCAIYKEILARPVEDWWLAPAFGAGCCSPRNPDRARLLAQNRGRADRPAVQPVPPHAVERRDLPVAAPGQGRSIKNGSVRAGIRADQKSTGRKLGQTTKRQSTLLHVLI